MSAKQHQTPGTASRRLGTDFTQGSIMKSLVRFLIPFFLANVLNSVYNMVDMIIIGKELGSVGTVAVSLGGRMLNLFTSASTALSGGGQILIAQQLGAEEKEKVNTSIGTLFSMLFVISCTMCGNCILFSGPILHWINTPEESFVQARTYLCITSLGMPLLSGYNAVCSVLRGMGDSRRPLLFTAIATLTNLLLDIVLIWVFGWGSAGAAMATVAAQGLSLILAVRVLYKNRDRFGFDFCPGSFKIHSPSAKVMLKIGVPNAAHGLVISLTQLLLVGYVNTFGLAEAAAWSVGDKIISLTNIMSVSVRQAGGAIVAQNIGAKKFDRVGQLVRSAEILTIGFAAVVSVFCLRYPQAWFSMFNTDPAVLAYSGRFMAIASLTFGLSAMSAGFACVTIGSGNSRLMFTAALLDGLVLRLTFSALFGICLGMGVVGLYLANSLARLAPLVCHSIYFFSGSWKKRGRLVS